MQHAIILQEGGKERHCSIHVCHNAMTKDHTVVQNITNFDVNFNFLI